MLDVQTIYKVTGNDGVTREYSKFEDLKTFVPYGKKEYGVWSPYKEIVGYKRAIPACKGRDKKLATIYKENGDILFEGVPLSIKCMFIRANLYILTDKENYPDKTLLAIPGSKFMEIKESNLINDWITLENDEYIPKKIESGFFNAMFGRLIITKDIHKIRIITYDDEGIKVIKELNDVDKIFYRIINSNILQLIIKCKSKLLEYYFSKDGNEYTIQLKRSDEN